jgi:hypothetical protein
MTYGLYISGGTNISAYNNVMTPGPAGTTADVRLGVSVATWVGNKYTTITGAGYAANDYKVGYIGFGNGRYSFAVHTGALASQMILMVLYQLQYLVMLYGVQVLQAGMIQLVTEQRRILLLRQQHRELSFSL